MNPSNFEAQRELLQRAVDFWFNWLLIATAMVFVGIVLELLEYVPLDRLSKIDSHTGCQIYPWKLFHWREAIIRVGVILVLLGVCGEGAFEHLVSSSEGRLRDLTNDHIKSLDKSATDNALETEKLRSENIGLQTQLARVQGGVLRLREQATPRRLSTKQRDAMTVGLKKLPKLGVRIVDDKFFPDSFDLSLDLIAAFESAGWRLEQYTTRTREPKDQVEGIVVEYVTAPTSPAVAVATALVRILREQGDLSVTGPFPSERVLKGNPLQELPGEEAVTRVHIRIGKKPLPTELR